MCFEETKTKLLNILHVIWFVVECWHRDSRLTWEDIIKEKRWPCFNCKNDVMMERKNHRDTKRELCQWNDRDWFNRRTAGSSRDRESYEAGVVTSLTCVSCTPPRRYAAIKSMSSPGNSMNFLAEQFHFLFCTNYKDGPWKTWNGRAPLTCYLLLESVFYGGKTSRRQQKNTFEQLLRKDENLIRKKKL